MEEFTPNEIIEIMLKALKGFSVTDNGDGTSVINISFNIEGVEDLTFLIESSVYDMYAPPLREWLRSDPDVFSHLDPIMIPSTAENLD